MRRILFLLVLGSVLPASAFAQYTITAPANGANAVASANDYATQGMQDPWDMNERTDLGYHLNSVDWPLPGWASVNFSGGLFSGTIASDPNVWLVETAYMNAAPIGKFGSMYPI